MTAHAMKGDRERCLDGGMDGYVTKPVNIREVAALLDRLAVAGGAGRLTLVAAWSRRRAHAVSFPA